MNKSELTSRQLYVLQFIEEQIAHLGYPPTIREIGRHLGVKSTNGVNDHLKALERKGYLIREGQKSRTLRIVKPMQRFDEPIAELMPLMALTQPNKADALKIPLFYDVSALQPFFSLKDAQSLIEVTSDMVGSLPENARLFATRVWQETHPEDDLQKGDLLILRDGNPHPGQRILFHWQGANLLRRFFSEGDMIRLQPDNTKHPALLLKKNEFHSSAILGILVALVRVF